MNPFSILLYPKHSKESRQEYVTSPPNFSADILGDAWYAAVLAHAPLLISLSVNIETTRNVYSLIGIMQHLC